MATFYYGLPSDRVEALGTWAAEASADTAYPATNVPLFDDLNLGNPGKLTIDGVGGWTVDFGAAQRVDWIVIWQNAAAGQAVQLQGHTSNSWGSPDITTTMTAPAVREDGYYVKLFKDMTGVSGYTTVGKRWWRIHYTGTGNVQSRGLKVMMGKLPLRTLARTADNTGLLLSGNKAAEHHRVLKLTTDFGFAWKYDLQDSPRGLSGQIVTSKQGTSYADLVSLYRSAKGPYSVFPLIKDLTINDVMLVRFGDVNAGDGLVLDELDITEVHPGVNTVSVAFSEISGGGPEWT